MVDITGNTCKLSLSLPDEHFFDWKYLIQKFGRNSNEAEAMKRAQALMANEDDDDEDQDQETTNNNNNSGGYEEAIDDEEEEDSLPHLNQTNNTNGGGIVPPPVPSIPEKFKQ